MRRNWIGFVLLAGWGLGSLPMATAFAQCPGTSGTATINGNAWTAACVLAGTASDCVDSLGSSYECFEIVGTNPSDATVNSVALFFGEPIVEGHTYGLGGTNPNGGMVFGEALWCITADSPYVGQATVSSYNAGAGTFECTFYFDARPIFLGSDVQVTAGHFIGTIVAVQPATWTGVKAIYR